MKQDVVDFINRKIIDIEHEHNVQILLAIESGSRAWGFESTDSDYDVRFIYRHDMAWYLHILPKRDVIEYPIDGLYDFSGWDIHKALYLMNKSNPVLFEWLNSPIVYKKNDAVFDLLKRAEKCYFSPITSIYHYLHMAKGNYREYLQGPIVKIKKYFYVLRPLFACMWIEKNDTNPPVEFESMMSKLELDSSLVEVIATLLARKRTGVEMGQEPRIPVINDFLSSKIEYFEKFTKRIKKNKKPGPEYIDKVFIDILNSN